ncbi:MAG TPA: polysaccharide pyruvyl transferase family protein, partial [Candidatus Ozemobacteraceae bacterium]|nr:polysaccharide pyruvyl transferase family protein [Candidatus Ozemobacteraceae bacterium]
ASARAVVVPGGGVLQSATSAFSLLYYVGLLMFGRAFGARLLMPAQGFGPWAPVNPTFWPELFAPLLAVVARLLCEYADHLSVRDTAAARAFAGLAFPALSMPVTADLVFALQPHRQRLMSNINLDDPTRPLRLGVVLRSQHPAATQLLTLLQGSLLSGRPLQIIPLSLRPGEDEEIWRAAPHLQAPLNLLPQQPFHEVLTTLDLLLSMRLHACIIAAQMRLPFIGIAVDPKIAQFAVDAGMPCLDASVPLTAEPLIGAFQSLATLPDPGAPLAALVATRRDQALATLETCARLLPPSPLS